MDLDFMGKIEEDGFKNTTPELLIEPIKTAVTELFRNAPNKLTSSFNCQRI